MITRHALPSILVLSLMLWSCGPAERDPGASGVAPAAAVASDSSPALEPPVETPEAASSSPKAIAPEPPSGLVLPERFTALGTEPFWAAKAEGDRLTYSTPDDQTGQTIPITRTASAQAIEVFGRLGGQRFVLTITPGPCSDGMSDRIYPLSVQRRLGEDEQRGCARPTIGGE